jgi:hypothetical protein
MALQDFLDSEVAVAVAATAALASPPVRGVLRRGAVYGLAGLLTVGEVTSSFARGAVRGAQQTASAANGKVQEATQQRPAEAHGEERQRTRRTRKAAAEGEGGAAQ